MKTLTLFNAFVIACQQSHETCVRLAGSATWLPTAEVMSLMRFGQRRERQIATLRPAIQARLTPPVPQPQGDYAADLVNDSEAGFIDQNDISSLSAG